MSHSNESTANEDSYTAFDLVGFQLSGSSNSNNVSNTEAAEQRRPSASQSATVKQTTATADAAVRDLATLIELVGRVACSENLEQAADQFLTDLRDCIEARSEPESLNSLSLFALHDSDASSRPSNEIGPVKRVARYPLTNNQHSETDEFELAAVRECLVRKQNASWSENCADLSFSGGRHALFCHRQLADQITASEVTTIRLQDSRGKLRAVLLATANMPLNEHAKRFLVTAATPVADQLSQVEKLTRRAWKAKWRSTVELLRGRKLMLALALALLTIGIGCWPATYRVRTQCEVAPSHRHFVTAPFDGILETCQLEAGDSVNAGATLATLDGRDLELELSQVEADLHRAKKALDGHLVLHESGDARIAQLEVDRLSARQELLLLRKQRLDILSPTDGVILNSEISESDGVPIDQGTVLFEIGELDRLEIEIAVPDEDMRHVRKGQTVTVRLDAFPFEVWKGTIERLSPASEIRNDANVFIATVAFDSIDSSMTTATSSLLEGESNSNSNSDVRFDSGLRAAMRPGMQGSAKIDCDAHPIAWNLLHKPVSATMRWLGW